MDKKSTFSTFGTAAKAEEGVKFPLLNPANGKDTGEWIMLRGTDSKTMQKAEAEADYAQALLSSEIAGKEKIINEGKDDAETKKSKLEEIAWERRERREAIARRHLAHCIVDWSNKSLNKDGTPSKRIAPTLDNVIAFFESAPHLQEQIDNFSFNRQNFLDQSFKNPSTV